MRHLGLAALAVVVIAACTTAAPAAAGTTLCKVNETPCSAANHYPIGTEFTATSGKMEFTTRETSRGKIVCAHSEIKGKFSSTGSAESGVEAQVQGLYFIECTLTTSLTEKVHLCANLPITLPRGTIKYTSAMNGSFTLTESEAGEPFKIQIQCPLGSTPCEYTSAGVTLDLNGGEEATLVATKDAFEGLTAGCPKFVDWDATYTFTAPSPLYVSTDP